MKTVNNNQEILNNLQILNITSSDEIYADCINDFHKRKYLKVFNSSLNKKEKNNLLIEINNAKEILEKIDIEDLKTLISEDNLINNKFEEKNYDKLVNSKKNRNITNNKTKKTTQNKKRNGKITGDYKDKPIQYKRKNGIDYYDVFGVGVCVIDFILFLNLAISGIYMINAGIYEDTTYFYVSFFILIGYRLFFSYFI